MSNAMTPTTEDVIRAAANVIIEPILALLQNDPHSWSTRPCGTCRAIQSITGKSFGCYLYAQQKIESAENRGLKQ